MCIVYWRETLPANGPRFTLKKPLMAGLATFPGIHDFQGVLRFLALFR